MEGTERLPGMSLGYTGDGGEGVGVGGGESVDAETIAKRPR